MNLVESAISWATNGHQGQVDWDKTTPYIYHPLRVLELVRSMGGDDVQCAAAVLHDLAEDTGRNPRLIVKLLNHKLEICGDLQELLELLTHDRAVTYSDYMARLVSNDRARLIKWADSTDNWARCMVLDYKKRGSVDKHLTKYTNNFPLLNESGLQVAKRVLHFRSLGLSAGIELRAEG